MPIVRLLLDAGADPLIKDKFAGTVFDAAVKIRRVGQDKDVVDRISDLLRKERPEEFMEWWSEQLTAHGGPGNGL
jgi:hypothetical protein